MLGFQGKELQFSSLTFSFLFLFFSFFSSFYFGRNTGLLFMGFLNLLKVVNETRVGFAKFRRFRQFFSLLTKPDVHSVWLAKGGRRRMKTLRIHLITYLTMHGTNLTSITLSSVSTFQLAG